MKTITSLLLFHHFVISPLNCQSHRYYCQMESFIGAHLPHKSSVERWSNEIENQFKEGLSIPHKVLSFLAFHWKDHLHSLKNNELDNLCKCIYVELFYSKPIKSSSVSKLNNPPLQFRKSNQVITQSLQQRTTAQCVVNGEIFFLHECRKKNLRWNCYDIYVSFYEHDLRRFYSGGNASSYQNISEHDNDVSMVAVAKDVKFNSLQCNDSETGPTLLKMK